MANETLGYYLSRIQQFLLRVGISLDRLRFRQHMNNEMAHYAVDCWDAECLTSHGWIECVGCADRSAYDLANHSHISGHSLSAQRNLSTPKEVDTVDILAKMDFLKRIKNKNSKRVKKTLEKLSIEQRNDALNALENEGFFDLQIDEETIVRLGKSDVDVKNVKKFIQIEDITPHVIEPSFGVGRIMYALLEHSFRKREGNEGNSYFALPALIAPHKCAVLPLVSKPQLQNFVKTICKLRSVIFFFIVSDSA